jgi:hypothetical protein
MERALVEKTKYIREKRNNRKDDEEISTSAGQEQFELMRMEILNQEEIQSHKFRFDGARPRRNSGGPLDPPFPKQT